MDQERERLLMICAPPFEWALGVIVSDDPTDLRNLAVGFHTRLFRERSDLHITSKLIYMRLYAHPSDYAADCLTPLEIDFEIRDIRDIIILRCPLVDGQSGIHMNLHLRRPPKCWVTINSVRRRATELDFDRLGGFEMDEERRPILATGEPTSACKIGRWLTHSFKMQEAAFRPLLVALKESPRYLSLLRMPAQLPSAAISPLSYLKYNVLPLTIALELRYAIDALLTAGVVVDYQVPQLLETIIDMKDDEKALRLMYLIYHKRRIFNLKAVMNKLQANILRRPMQPATPQMVLVCKLVVTPTRILIFPPESQTSNFVLRRFPKQVAEGRFLRVQFWDEGGRLSMGYERRNDDEDANEGILARFKRCMNQGLAVGRRTYWPLDYSSSQCRSHSFWAICEDKASDFTRKNVRLALGDFSKERIIAKNAARRGQLYSTTNLVVSEVGRIERVPDFRSDDHHYVYSDGCSYFGRDLMDLAARACKVPEHDVPSCAAVQVRIAGAKGMLVAWPGPPLNADGSSRYPDLPWPVTESNTIYLRPSQIKFEATHKQLGAIKASSFQAGFLNREVLVILFELGISSALVMSIFDEQVKQISLKTQQDSVGVDLRNSQHQRVLRSSNLDVIRLIHVGMEDEPMIQAIIRLCFHRALFDLREKAKIFVEDAAHLFGVVDELGVLEEGQIFCRIKNASIEHTVTGHCIIFRAPTRHVGDVQPVQAVDHPALHDSGLVNVIIFPRKGSRDLASQLGGGDLDGDTFTLIWDQHLTSIRPEEPADYSAPDPIYAKDKVTAEMTRAFFSQYMKQDKLGAISNCHLALADKLGASHPDCLELSDLHSVAVDFAKTGVAAELPKELRPVVYPDFMGRRLQGDVYEAQSPLGLMFRHPSVNPFPTRKSVEHLRLDGRIAKLAKTSKAITGTVDKLRLSYEMELNALTARFECTEEEILSGVILPLPGGLQRLDKEDKARDPLSASFASICRDHLDAASKLVEQCRNLSMLNVAATAYLTTYEANSQRAVNYRRHSFPFVFVEALLEIVSECG